MTQFFELLQLGSSAIHGGEDVTLRNAVTASLADCWKNHVPHPSWKGFGLWLARAEYQGIKAGFGNNEQVGIAPISIINSDGIPFIIIQVSASLSNVPHPQNLAHILSHKPGFAILHNDAHLAKLYKVYQKADFRWLVVIIMRKI